MIPGELHFNGLSPAEDERLALLMEEAAEVIKAACKVQRHGYSSTHDGLSNRQALELECGHFLHALCRMTAKGDINDKVITEHAEAKLKTIWPYLHHQEPNE